MIIVSGRIYVSSGRREAFLESSPDVIERAQVLRHHVLSSGPA